MPWPRRPAPVVQARCGRRRFGGVLAGLVQQRRQGLGLQALEHAEVGHRQRGALEVAQQGQPGLAFLLLRALALGLLGLLGLGLAALLGLRQLLALARDLAPAGQLVAGQLAVFLAQVAGGLAVQVEARRRLAQRDQVGGAGGVAPEEGRQRGLGEHARRALVDVGLDAQLQRPGMATEQRRKVLLEQIRAGRRRDLLARRLAGQRRSGLGRCGDWRIGVGGCGGWRIGGRQLGGCWRQIVGCRRRSAVGWRCRDHRRCRQFGRIGHGGRRWAAGQGQAGIVVGLVPPGRAPGGPPLPGGRAGRRRRVNTQDA